MSIRLCSRPNACCPELDYDQKTDTISITDDDGDIVTMNLEQFQILQKVNIDDL